MSYKYKIGQEIEFTNDFFIETAKGEKLEIKKGDRAMVVKKIDDNTGEIVYINGNAKGLSQNINIQVDDKVDEEEIAKKILESL
ncbi:hypothetical protein BD780_000590 [Clostridium tetanomorphum]|uniref:Uncharacterized protein n=1 Tax=Clostridium tetanomorphum TaxID=1553 RepID=A0A923EAG4_CLOTT|nr:hypothetical protein [Clostridium tetanomorphum]KAJ51800.1 hypothetical protein CTM_11058 [Clostridium tetanomorphum DSM 665]MBC2397681.1 hypothetical protein [Clostridium tetanomorphum]MBP1865037.1 hypothetical protein [Clostridium tetanomorphum]NRS83365.1 hypothetical protein [Clostridium tetanomorphum]NRZ96565.1 hypothetical protein [Clostridium tetanomorphum]